MLRSKEKPSQQLLLQYAAVLLRLIKEEQAAGEPTRSKRILVCWSPRSAANRATRFNQQSAHLLALALASTTRQKPSEAKKIVLWKEQQLEAAEVTPVRLADRSCSVYAAFPHSRAAVPLGELFPRQHSIHKPASAPGCARRSLVLTRDDCFDVLSILQASRQPAASAGRCWEGCLLAAVGCCSTCCTVEAAAAVALQKQPAACLAGLTL